MAYHGLPVSKRHGILPWLPCFKTPWTTMVSMVYHGILPLFCHDLPWFTCFKASWHLLWYDFIRDASSFEQLVYVDFVKSSDKVLN